MFKIQKIKLPKTLSVSLKILLSGLALFIVFRKIDVEELGLVIREASVFYLLVAALFFVLSKVLASSRLQKFLQDVEIPISWKANFRLYWLGMYYNLFLPGGIGGDGYKIYLLNKHHEVKTKRIFSAVLVDRLSGVFALSVLASLLSSFIDLPFSLHIIMLVYIPIGVLLFYFLIRKFWRSFQRRFFITLSFSFGVQILQLFSAFFLLWALGVENDMLTYLFVFLLSSIVAMIPFTIGGVGARELTFIYAAQFFGLDMEPAVGMSFLFFLITALVSIYGIRFSFTKNLKQLV